MTGTLPISSPLTAVPGVLEAFAPIGLAAMDGVALLDRRDTKFVLSPLQLLGALSTLAGTYRILEINGRREHRYRTLYFDTPRLDLFRAHHRDQPNRYKVRSREYIDTELAFLEVKRRTKNGRTQKSRLPSPAPVTRIGAEEACFLERAAALPPSCLSPVLANDFTRVTLAGLDAEERVTLDFSLRFTAGEEELLTPGVAVAEVKEEGTGRRSPFIQAMRRLGIHATGFSKYCIGVSMLYPETKHNRFNADLLRIRNLSRCDIVRE